MDSIIIFCAKYLLYVSVIIFVVFFLKLQNKLKKEFLIFAFLSFLFSLIIAKIASKFYYDPRPFVVEHIKPLVLHAADNGFPSDHTLLTMAIASVVFVYNKKLGILLFTMCLLVGGSRVVASIHHPIDIFGSIVIAAVVTFVVFQILNKFFGLFAISSEKT